MKKILIIGGCGYIGSRLYEVLVKNKKFKIDTVDTEWFGNVINKKNIQKNYRTLSKKFLAKFDVIILLAGFSSVAMCNDRLSQSFKNDVQNFVHLLSKLDGQKFIYASSSSIYGNTRKMEVTEEWDRYIPSNYYDLHKKIIDHYAQMSNTNYYGLRFGTVCGYSPHLRIDLMINKMHEVAKKTGKIIIHNPDMHRPILGLEDLCRAIKTIIEGKDFPGIYNLASFNATIREVTHQVKKSMGNIEIIVKDTESLYNFSVNTTKFEKVFGFTFKETVGSIVHSLHKKHSSVLKTTRE